MTARFHAGMIPPFVDRPIGTGPSLGKEELLDIEALLQVARRPAHKGNWGPSGQSVG